MTAMADDAKPPATGLPDPTEVPRVEMGLGPSLRPKDLKSLLRIGPYPLELKGERLSRSRRRDRTRP